MFISEGKLDDQLISVKIYPQYISNSSLSDYDHIFVMSNTIEIIKYQWKMTKQFFVM